MYVNYQKPIATALAISQAWIVVLFVAAIAGCSKSAESRLPSVSGRVTLDGQPLAQASVVFRAKDNVVGGLTDNDGYYRLERGALPGDYRVDISKREGGASNTIPIEPGAIGRPHSANKASEHPKQMIPARYSDRQQTVLSFTVAPSDKNQADFELTSKQQ